MAFVRGLKTPALYLVALLLLLVANRAIAGHYSYPDAPPCTGSYTARVCPTQADAEANVYYTDNLTASDNYFCGGAPTIEYRNVVNVAAKTVTAERKCSDGSTWSYNAIASWTANTGPTDAECLAKANIFTPFQFWTGSVGCLAGCEYVAANAGNGGEVVMAPTGACEGGTNYNFDGCPVGYTDRNEMVGVTTHGSLMIECVPDNSDIDGDGINNDEDLSPDEPGDQSPTDTDSDGIPDAKDSAPDDPDNGKELEDGETKATSVGGGNCDTPPETKGDAVGAQIAHQTWQTRCAIERLKNVATNGNPSGSTCGQLLVCTGLTKTQCFELGLQKRAVCAAEEAASIGAGTGTDNAKLAEIEENTASLKGDTTFAETLAGAGASDGELTAEDAFGEPGDGAGGDLSGGFNDDGFLSAPRECPDLPTITLPDGGTIDLDEKFTMFCEFMRIGGLFVYLFGALASIKIYSKVFS